MKELTDKQRQAAQMLASGSLCRDAAEAVSVAPETISAWKAQPAFKAYCEGLRMEMHYAARDALRAKSMAAVEVLGQLLTSAKSEDVRRKAAVDILNLMGHADIQKYWLGALSAEP